jgi:carbonic anhydrase
MKSFEKLLANNKQWAAEQLQVDPEFFTRLEALQSPEFLWIGCSDSRVPANQITGTFPGEVFVHRNIANLVVPGDLNVLSVLEYSVSILKIKHLIVCGHYGCGGVQAAMNNNSFGLLDNWLIHIKNVYRTNKAELDAISNEAQRFNRLVELNVLQQVEVLTKLPVITEAWKTGERPLLHGWVYSLGNGIIKPLIQAGPGAETNRAETIR